MAESQPSSSAQDKSSTQNAADDPGQWGALLERWCLVSSALVTLLATTAIIGWHTGYTFLFQVFAQFAPMQYNTALCFISCGVALFSAMKRWHTVTLIATIPAFLISALTLAEYFYGTPIGNLDQFFIEAYVHTNAPYPGRPSLFTSLSFLLSSFALFGTAYKARARFTSSVTAVLASLVVSISLLGLFGYFIGLSGAQSWSLIGQMSLPTVLCFLIVGSGVLIVAWQDYKLNVKRSPMWVPIAVFIASLAITMTLANAIHGEEQRNARIKNVSNMIAVRNTLETEINDRQHSIRRMANRWAQSELHVRSRWESDVHEYLQDDTGYRFIAWADENFILQWVVPDTQNITPNVTPALPESYDPQEIIHSLQRSANVSIRHIGSDLTDLCVVGLIINDNGDFGGCIIASFDKQKFFHHLMPKQLAEGYDFEINLNGHKVYQRGQGVIPEQNPWIQKREFNLHGSDWSIVMWPTEETLRTEYIFYSKLIITLGVIISAILALSSYLAQIASVNSKQASRRNVRLQEEISERIRSRNELQRASALNKAIVIHSAHAVITTDASGLITSFNPAAERMLGYNADELIGKHTPAIIHDLEEVAARSKQIANEYGEEIEPGFDVFVYEARKGLDSQIEWSYIRKNGSRFPVSLAVTAITNDEGAITGYLGVAIDISELKYAMAELKSTHKKLLDTALETARMKSQFLANMSHEIRTPMNGIIGMSELLSTTDLSDSQKEHVGIITQSGNALLTIINDILDSAKIESGKIEFQQLPFNINEVITGAIQTVSAIAAKKGIALKSEVDEKITGNLLGDPGRLRQVLLNLVSNAVKFTSKGSVELSVTELNETKESRKLRFAVKDSGIGISPDQINHIFQPFSQVDDTDKRTYGGTGLGLTISSQIVQAMDGTIRVKSNENQGSEFWFEITLKKTGQKSISESEEKKPLKITQTHTVTTNKIPEELMGQGLRILIAEDNPVNQQVTTMQLQRIGHQSDLVTNGEEAVAAMQKKPYDVVLMDCQMPVMDGLEATRRIRKLKKHSSVHIIALTANAMKEDRQKCLDAGMDDYLSKPINATDLAKALSSIHPDQQDQIPDQASEQTNETKQAVDFERLREVTGNDQTLFNEISDQYLKQADEIIENLGQAVQSGNQEEAGKLAHKLAGSSATCGMAAVVGPLRALEALKNSENTQATELLVEITSQMKRIRHELKNHS